MRMVLRFCALADCFLGRRQGILYPSRGRGENHRPRDGLEHEVQREGSADRHYWLEHFS